MLALHLGTCLTCGPNTTPGNRRLCYPARYAAATRINNPKRHLHFLFAGLGHVARETGTIKQQQIDLVEKLIQELELGGSGREQAVTWFEEGKAGTTSFDRLARQCRTGRFTRARLRPLALTQMCRIAAVQPTQKAYDAVIRLGAMQGISPRRATAEFTRTMGGANVKRQQPSKAAQNAQQSELHAAYKTLGLPISASKGQAKHAYRRLVNKHHPDKLGPNISTANKAKAEATLIELRAALDLINGQP